ncbi:MAG TPA: HNH endonuclease [Candidatus Limnocylindria bacterium]|nr:HNH endonuclease [Candidatus Limnocylindria bacterium]
MADPRMFPPGTRVSPSGRVVVAPCGRRVTVGGPTATEFRKGHCSWCGREVPKPRRSWCSDECVAEFWDRDSNTIRSRVLQRDKGKPCAICGAERFCPEVDHTVPIIEGGHPWDLANLRTICDVCHKAETRALARRRAERRAEERRAGDPQLAIPEAE